MDRRKFFKIFGGAAAVPFVPFKWAARQAKAKPKGGSTKSLIEPTRLFIDGVEYTNKCFSIEMTVSAWAVMDVTSMGDRYRRYDRVPETITIKVGLYGECDMEFSGWHHIAVYFDDKSVMAFRAQHTYKQMESAVRSICRMYVEFVGRAC